MLQRASLYLLLVLLCGVAARADSQPADPRAVADATETVWIPPPGELRGYSVDIAVLGTMPKDMRRTWRDRGTEMSAGGLYQLLVLADAEVRIDSAWSHVPSDPPSTRTQEVENEAAAGALRVRIPTAAGAGGKALADSISQAFDDADLTGPDFDSPAEGADKEPAGDRDNDAAEVTLRLTWNKRHSDDSALIRQSRAYARALYAGIRTFCVDDAKPAGSEDMSSSAFDAKAELPRPGALKPEVTRRLERLAHDIWPNGALPNDRVAWFCRMFVRLAVTNRSLVFCDLSAAMEDDVVVLRGATNAPSVSTGLEYALRQLGAKRFDNRIRTLPDGESLGDHLYGVCRVPHALTYAHADADAGKQTQLLFGEPLFLLGKQGDWMLVHAADGYWGWVRSDAVQLLTERQFRSYTRLRQAAVIENIDESGTTIPRGARVPVVSRDRREWTVLLPDGTRCAVPTEKLMVDDKARARAGTRVAAAVGFLGKPYVFGGRSPDGLDCSGLLSNVAAQVNRTASRDAWHQAFDGELVATWWSRDGIEPGDQVFFIDPMGKIYHTGIAISATHVVHAAPPFVRIGSLRRGDPLFDERLDRDFFMAKRP